MARSPAWNIAAGDLSQQIAIQTMTIGSPGTRGKPAQIWPDTITAASWLAGVATFTVQGALPSTFKIGSTVLISGMTPSGYNGTFSVASVPGANQFTVAIAVDPTAATKLGSIACDPPSGTLVRCKVEPLTGRKLEIARQYVPTASHLVTMRFRTLNENKHRLVYKLGRVLNIGRLVDVEERHVKLEITCTELKPQPGS